MVQADDATLDELLSRSIDTIYPDKTELKKKLQTGQKLKIYVGIDPSASYVHLGHSTNYLILKRFHKLGHKIIVLVGDFTALIGDPSDKSAARIKLRREDVANNLKTFKDQIGKILDFEDKANPIEFKFNSEWLAKLTFEDAVELASNFTVQQMIERDAFQKRLKDNRPLFVHEFFYPLMQGYDSVAMDVDIELGGTDQTFNMLAGRTLLKRYKDKDKFVITTTLLENPKTGEKLMSKSLGTGIGLDEPAREMFGKVMALPDEAMIQVFIDCTELPMSKIENLKKQLANGTNPRDIKQRLATEIVTMYQGEAAADKAKDLWTKQFSTKDLEAVSEELPELSLTKIDSFLKNNNLPYLVAATVVSGNVKSNSEARRLFDQGAYSINGEKQQADTQLQAGQIFRVGRNAYRVVE